MLAIVKLKKRRNGRVYDFIDYISYDLAKIEGIEIQGIDNYPNEFSRVEIVKRIEK